LESVRQAVISADALRSLIVLVLGAAALYLLIDRKIKAKYAVLAVAVITLADLYTVNKRYLNTDSFATPTENQASFEPRAVDRQILADTAINYRVLDQPRFSDAAPSYFHKHIGGYHAAKLTRYQDLIDHQISKGNAEVMNMLNTKYVIVNDEQVYVNDQALGNAWFVDTLTYVTTPNEEMEALNTIHAATQAVADKQFEATLGAAQQVAPGDTIYETTYAPNRLTYCARSAKGGVAVFSEIFFPWGWKATVDGEEAPIARVNYVLRALKVPAGHHTIEFSFEPQSVKTTDNIATVAIIIIYLSILVALNVGVYRRLRSDNASQDENKKEY
ncbi:MAG: YfhO family protein, partial [Muribaculaceae bacterium]|nr:YfhO family protein [Muribaculaceae bacterium]